MNTDIIVENSIFSGYPWTLPMLWQGVCLKQSHQLFAKITWNQLFLYSKYVMHWIRVNLSRTEYFTKYFHVPSRPASFSSVLRHDWFLFAGFVSDKICSFFTFYSYGLLVIYNLAIQEAVAEVFWLVKKSYFLPDSIHLVAKNSTDGDLEPNSEVFLSQRKSLLSFHLFWGHLGAFWPPKE